MVCRIFLFSTRQKKAKMGVSRGAKDALDKNNYLNNQIARVQALKRELSDKGIPLTPTALRDAYRGKTGENRGVLEIFDEHNQKCEELKRTALVQELHLPVYHAICMMVENYFFVQNSN